MDEERVEVTIPSRPAFSREQKFGYAVVIGCGVLAVLFGGFYMVKHIKAPFIITYNGDQFVTGEEAAAAEVQKQKSQDTDGDTISDYDELNIYGSSPYLTDTDSDGRTDDFEIANNMDPACATGSACENARDDIGTENPLADGLIGETIDEYGNVIAAGPDDVNALTQMLKDLPVADVRAMLAQSGVDEATLSAMTDAEVLAMYQSVIAELEQSGSIEAIVAAAQEDAQAAADTETETQTETQAETPDTQPTTP